MFALHLDDRPASHSGYRPAAVSHHDRHQVVAGGIQLATADPALGTLRQT